MASRLTNHGFPSPKKQMFPGSSSGVYLGKMFPGPWGFLPPKNCDKPEKSQQTPPVAIAIPREVASEFGGFNILEGKWREKNHPSGYIECRWFMGLCMMYYTLNSFWLKTFFGTWDGCSW